MGVVGIFVPMLPTTPFLLLAAALFARSSPRLYDWLLGHPRLGPYIRAFREERAIPLRVKVWSLVLLWVAILFSIFCVAAGRLWLQILLATIAVGVTVHILSFATLKRK